MNNLSPAQQKVFDEALNKTKGNKWFSTICPDDFPDTQTCELDFNGAVRSVVTAMWNDPK